MNRNRSTKQAGDLDCRRSYFQLRDLPAFSHSIVCNRRRARVASAFASVIRSRQVKWGKLHFIASSTSGHDEWTVSRMSRRIGCANGAAFLM
jgi:hypothetical protein